MSASAGRLRPAVDRIEELIRRYGRVKNGDEERKFEAFLTMRSVVFPFFTKLMMQPR